MRLHTPASVLLGDCLHTMMCVSFTTYPVVAWYHETQANSSALELCVTLLYYNEHGRAAASAPVLG